MRAWSTFLALTNRNRGRTLRSMTLSISTIEQWPRYLTNLHWVMQRHHVRPSNFRFDDECLAAKKLSRLGERQYKSSNLAVNRTTGINQLPSYHRLCDSKRSLFWKFQIEGRSMNPKMIWGSINAVLGQTTKQFQSKHSADDFADFFIEKVAKIREDTDNSPPPTYTETEGQWLNEFQPVTEEEQKMILSSPD